MPIPLSCQCGKTLNVRDEHAGKKVKCPACGSVLQVPGGSQQGATQQPAPQQPAPRPAAPRPAATAGASSRMDDLFNEEGFSEQVAAVCPACRAEMPAGAVLCTKCGYHTQTGERYESHKTAGVDIDQGTIALQKAESDMAEAKKMQKDMIAGAGMPWWMLALVLFMIGSGLTIAVLAVNASRRVDTNFNFNPLALFFFLAALGCQMVSMGAQLLVVVHAFKQDVVKGVLCMFVPFYILYHVIKNWDETWRFFVAAMIMGFIAGGFYGAMIAQGGV